MSELDDWKQFEADAKREINRHVAYIRRERKSTIRWMIVFGTLVGLILVLIIGLGVKGHL